MLEQNPELAEEIREDGISACLVALYYGHKDLAEQIASAKSELTIFEAAAFGRVAELERMITAENICSFSPDGFQPLHLAAYFGRNEAVRLLLSARAPINEHSKNPLRVTPLHSALANQHETIVRELIVEGADVNAVSGNGLAPMQYVVESGNRPLALFLKDHGSHEVRP